MFKNYLKIALRNLRRQKVYSFINIAGLAIGMACAILILLWVQDELSFDRFHENGNRIYRVLADGRDKRSFPQAESEGKHEDLRWVQLKLRSLILLP